MSARPIYTPVDGAPYQPGARVIVVDAVDADIDDGAPFVGCAGEVLYLEYSCGAGQRYPTDPMIGVRLASGVEREFWREELMPR